MSSPFLPGVEYRGHYGGCDEHEHTDESCQPAVAGLGEHWVSNDDAGLVVALDVAEGSWTVTTEELPVHGTELVHHLCSVFSDVKYISLL